MPHAVPARTASSRRRRWRALAYWGIALSLLCGIALAAFAAREWSLRQAFDRLDDTALRQLELYASVLEHELAKQDDLPGLLDVDGDIEALLLQPASRSLGMAASRRLTRFTVRSGMVSTEVVDMAGHILAASDWYEPATRLGATALASPCVRDTLSGGETRHFAAGITGAPEVCLGRVVERAGRKLGAVLIRMSLAPTEATWVDAAFRDDSERPFVTDEHDQIILSAAPPWKGRTLAQVTQLERRLPHGALLVRLSGAPSHTADLFLLHQRPLTRLGWRLHVLASTRQVWRDARTAAWGGGAAAASVGLLLVVVAQRRRVLAQKLAAREALQRANDQLEQKVRQRTAELERTQQDLVQAGKLALLGQLSAGISHELGQPLTALRGLAGNARVLLERHRHGDVAVNLEDITQLVERMGRITAQLKAFVRKSPTPFGPVVLARAVENARQLVAARLAEEQVALLDLVPADLSVVCDGARLEQVLVNLLVNALDALRGAPVRRITVSAHAVDGRAVVQVADSGPGLDPRVRERLFEPFLTTKPAGEGIGLGLVISQHIVHEVGGALRAAHSEVGATFEFDLPLAEEPVKEPTCSTD
ncbi:sensor histidine kinase [Variovorax terrae]|uniref:C4-dicarboxylate transport sensor protein DctB n=1 Tax=Variovorax terrae TaxID=2923278 RepID=A0A9X1VWS8_9BURK|nr:ATP-binding protein [Variovorax terrae]MCJ0763514.1 ATP-binding protein [Variovorax terrae]